MALRFIALPIVLGAVLALVLRATFTTRPHRPTRTLEDVLATEWGSEWSSRREEFMRSGQLTVEMLTSGVDAAELIPWREVEPQVIESVIGPGFDPDWFHKGFEGSIGLESQEWISNENVNPTGRDLRADELELFQELLHSLDAELASIAAEVMARFQEALYDTVAERRYLFYPVRFLSGQEHPKKPRQLREGAYAYHQAILIDGWGIDIRVDSIDYPDLDRAYRYLEERRRWRLDQIARFVSQ
jgi:hypothetical protein